MKKLLLIMQQMNVLKGEVQACVSLGDSGDWNQLAENYKKDWTRRQSDFRTGSSNWPPSIRQLSEFLEEYVLDPVSISEIERQSDHRCGHLNYHSLGQRHRTKSLLCGQCHARAITRIRGLRASFDDVEEERRVLYVALTRAKNELILTKQNLNSLGA